MDDLVGAHVIFTKIDDWKGEDPVEHVRYACDNVDARLQVPEGPLNDEPIAIVGYGPSLRETWEEVKNYKTIFSCSGAHKFLLDHGVVPTYHVDSDPHAHKPKMLGDPHPDVTYLISSICHPTYFDKLKGHKVILWHILFFEPKALHEALPKNEWIVAGGGTIGMRIITIARIWNYTNVHLFGFDGNAAPDQYYAGQHLNPPTSGIIPFIIDGNIFQTTENWIYQASVFFEHMDRILPDVQYTFHGEGMMAAMAHHHRRKSYPFSPKAVRL